MTDIAVENGPLIGDLPSYKMLIFHSYVSLPEGTRQFPSMSMGFQSQFLLIQLMCPAGVYSPHAACGLLGCAHRSERHVVFLMLGSWRAPQFIDRAMCLVDEICILVVQIPNQSCTHTSHFIHASSHPSKGWQMILLKQPPFPKDFPCFMSPLELTSNHQ